MKILSIELQGYTRFALSQYDNFFYCPDQKFQLILGTNGSGKSSLMSELSPLPAVAADFRPGGYKEIKIEKDNTIYTLKSHFTSSSKHSFKQGEDELNLGGTAQVQRDLVEQYFNITPETHEVMTGKDRFSSMSVSKRREWFTRMSHIDFDYAVKLYQNLKNRYKEVDNILKYQQSILLTELTKLVDPAESIKLKQEIHKSEEVINYLITEQEKIDHIQGTVSFKEIEEQLLVLIVSVRSQLKLAKQYGFKEPLETIQQTIYSLEIELSGIKVKSNFIAEQIEKQQSILKNMEGVGQLTLEDLKNKLKTLQDELKNKTDQLVYLNAKQSPEELCGVIDIAYNNLFDLLQELPLNSDRKFNKQEYLMLTEQIQQSNITLKTLQQSVIGFDQSIKVYEHAQTHQKTTCPQCQYVWIRDFDENKYQALIKEKQIVLTKINDLEESIKLQTEKANHISSYLEKYRTYVKIRDQLTSIYPVWEQIDQQNLIFKNPIGILRVFEIARKDTEVLKEIHYLQNELKETEKFILIQEKNTAVDIKKLTDENNALMFQYAGILKQIRGIEFKLSQYRNKALLHSKIIDLVKEIETLIADCDRKEKEEINFLHWKGMKELINEIKLDVNEKRVRVASSYLQQEIVDRLKTTINELSIEKETLSKMIEKLSPKDGLIARSLTGFINHFVGQMNSVISQIWSYSCELLPVNESDESLDLDYRFEVSVNNQKPIPDILKCSTGMQEVIDLAFKIVSMAYCGLSDAPIFLDEFGKSMDSFHRTKAFDTITSLIANSNYSQIFMVSHYEQAYGALQHADLVVLDGANIVIPPGTNVNKVITTG